MSRAQSPEPLLPQVEVLLGEFWDPSSGAVFAEEGDQQRFWKLTRRFIEGLASEEGSPYAGRIKAVRPSWRVSDSAIRRGPSN